MMFDAIVVGSGLTGGWAAKVLTERGLKVLIIERGSEHDASRGPIEYDVDETLSVRTFGSNKRIQQYANINKWNEHFFVDDDVDVYQTPNESGFRWLRGYQLGGRALTWGRHCYRLSEMDFAANSLDGHGLPWPVRYNDIAAWYETVERFMKITGTVEHLHSVPDGIYESSASLTEHERCLSQLIADRYPDRRLIPGRVATLSRAIRHSGVSECRDEGDLGQPDHASLQLNETLRAAYATKRLTVLTDTIVETIDYDPSSRRATGVKVCHLTSGSRSTYTARLLFLCAGSINSTSILLRSISEANPYGLGNSSGFLGTHMMDHAHGARVTTTIPGGSHDMQAQPNGFIVPRFVNLNIDNPGFLRGYSFQGWSGRCTLPTGDANSGGQETAKGDETCTIAMFPSAECLPRVSNRITIDLKTRDIYGLPITRIDLRWSDNERRALAHAHRELCAMISLCGGVVNVFSEEPVAPPGTAIHEMGGAGMGSDPRSSVTNSFNQLHDANNVFVTDGAFMNSTGDRNPSLTYMAFTARAAFYAADLLGANSL